MKQNHLIIILLCCLPGQIAYGQTIWTLRQCIEYAQTHNIQISQQNLQIEQKEIDLNTQKWRHAPSLDASANESFGFGRALTYDNTYANRNTQNTGLGISANIPVFTGFEIKHSREQAGLNLEAAIQDLEKAKESLALQVASNYLNVLYYSELAEVAHQETATQHLLLEQVKAYWENGKKSEAEVYEAQAQLAQNELNATRADNDLKLAILDLAQLLELPSPDSLSIAPVEGDTMDIALELPEQIFEQAQWSKPEIKAENLRLQSSAQNINIAQAGYYPKLYLNAGIGTSYYKTSGYNSASFGQQMRDNFTQNVGLSLSLPLFDRMQTRNNIRTAKVQHILQQLQVEDVKKKLYKEIQQAYYNAEAARVQFKSSASAMISAQAAYKLMHEKYLNGKATSTELQTQRTQWLKAKSERVQAKYEWILRKKILDFYAGKKLE